MRGRREDEEEIRRKEGRRFTFNDGFMQTFLIDSRP